MACLVPAARGHAGGEDRQVHAVQAVQELVKKFPLHPPRQSEGGEARPRQAGRPLVWRPKLGDGRRRVTQPGTPCLPVLLPLRAVP